MKRLLPLLLCLALLASLLSSCGDFSSPTDGTTLSVHVIDVGQGDAILVRTASAAMLIDAGDRASAHKKALTDYLTAQRVASLDYLVLTHPDADHIGGAVTVLESFTVRRVVMPSVTKSTETFNDLVSTLEKNETIEVIEARADLTFSLGTATCRLLSPSGDRYAESNDYSAVIRLQYGDKVFLLAGDAGLKPENEMLKNYPASILRADVLKVAHHGADEASSAAFLSAVRPTYAAISCGKGNSYGHPKQTTLDALAAVGAAVYRTDLDGTVVFTTDGRKIEVSTEK